MMSSTLSLSAACPPLSAQVFSDHGFPPSLARRWKKPWLQPRSEDAQTWVTMARPTTQVHSRVSARGAQQRICKPTPRTPQTGSCSAPRFPNNYYYYFFFWLPLTCTSEHTALCSTSLV